MLLREFVVKRMKCMSSKIVLMLLFMINIYELKLLIFESFFLLGGIGLVCGFFWGEGARAFFGGVFFWFFFF